MTTETAEPSVKKSACERYDVRSGKGCDWAIIMVDEASGVLQIHSDYGNWSHSWPHHGRPSFKAFIVELGRDTDYLMTKLGGSADHYKPDETMRACLAEICKQRRCGNIDKQTARDAYLQVQDCDNNSAEELFSTIAYYAPLREVFGDEAWETVPLVQDYEPGLKNFVTRLWPVFVAAIKKELEA